MAILVLFYGKMTSLCGSSCLLPRMISALSLLLITTGLAVVMLFVLTSLAGSKIAGVREWGQANGIAILGLALAACRGIVPDFLSIEAGNGLLAVAICLMLAGFRRHLGLPVPTRPLAGGCLLTVAAVAGFHYGVDSLPLRTVTVSLFHGIVCCAIGFGIPLPDQPRLRYAYLFTKGAALLLALGHLVRGLAFALQSDVPAGFLEPTTQNLVFFALGTLALPGLTLGAVMMANARMVSDATYAAEHDHLTGAPSRRAFFDAAEREHARAVRHGSELGMLVLDVDYFKRINDTHGHAIGDGVLRDLVRQTRDTIRTVDYCARIGGEEFAVLLPDASLATTLAVAERLRAALDRSLRAAPGLEVAYTVSIGAAMLAEGESVGSLLARADAALYAAKAGGRNRVVSAAVPLRRQHAAGRGAFG